MALIYMYQQYTHEVQIPKKQTENYCGLHYDEIRTVLHMTISVYPLILFLLLQQLLIISNDDEGSKYKLKSWCVIEMV